MTLRQMAKRCVFGPMSLWHRCAGACAPARDVRMQPAEALEVLSRHGYEARPLWEGLRELPEAVIDLSLIIPVYNAERVLGRCLDSLMGQEAEGVQWEVVCVNDGSTDGSGGILARYAEAFPERVRVVTQANGGISRARNRGLEASRGEYVGFLDNDDAVQPGYIGKLMAEARRTGADMVQCGFRYVNAGGGLMAIEAPEAAVATADEPERMEAVTSGYIWGGVLRRSLFRNVRFPEGFWYEDMITKMLLMRLAGKVARIADALYVKYIHGDNASVTLWRPADIRSADCWLLASLLCRHLREMTGLAPDLTQLRLLLYEWTTMLGSRTAGLPEEARLALFSLCSADLEDYSRCASQLTGTERSLYLTFARGAFRRWHHLSRARAYELR